MELLGKRCNYCQSILKIDFKNILINRIVCLGCHKVNQLKLNYKLVAYYYVVLFAFCLFISLNFKFLRHGLWSAIYNIFISTFTIFITLKTSTIKKGPEGP